MLDRVRPPEGVAIAARGLGVRYRRYLKKITTLKEAVISMFQGTHYQSFWALRGVDFTLARGERLGVIGPNGSGKSTLLKAIAGVLPPSEGEIATHGRIAPLLELGGGFRPNLTGRENVFLNGAIMGCPQREMEEKFDRIVEFAGIGDFIDAPLNTYSSGMRARLGFAVATDVDPDILLLDEILSVGDAEFHHQAVARTQAFFESGKTVVLVSHNMGHIGNLCDRAIYLRKGQIVRDGPAPSVIEAYLADAQPRANS